MPKRAAIDPLAEFPDDVWQTLSELTGHSIGQVRGTLKVYLSALEQAGYELVGESDASRRRREVDWDHVAALITKVLGDVANERDCGFTVTYETEVGLIISAIRRVVER